MKTHFDTKRFSQTLLKEIVLNKTNIIIMLASLTFLSLLVNYISHKPYLPKKLDWLQSDAFPIITLIYSMVVTSNSFSELNVADRKIEFLMMPSTILEKFLVKFFYTTVGYIVLSVAALSFSAIIVELYLSFFPAGSLFEKILHSYNTVNLWEYLRNYLMLHSLLFFGGIYFRKLELGKTFLSVVGCLGTLGIFMGILNMLPFFEKVSPSFFSNLYTVPLNFDNEASVSIQSQIKLMNLTISFFNIAFFAASYILPIFFWILSYIQLKENEVADGI